VGHALAITGPGVPATRTDVLSPGGTAQLTVTLQAGSYELWCPVDGHKGLGMDTHIQVGAAATGTTPSPSTSTSTSGSGY
jgi:plastocyanin